MLKKSAGSHRGRGADDRAMLVVAIDSPPGLASEPPGGDQVSQAHSRTKSLAKCVRQRLQGQQERVMPVALAEFPRSDGEVEAEAQGAVDVLGRADALFEHAHALQSHDGRDARSQEAWAVLPA